MNNPVTHIAFIMDGNGRWAKARRLPRIEGHRRGLNTAERTIDACLALGVKYVTLYVFSTENWKRDKKEVDGLFDLAYRYIDRFEVFCRDKARVVVSGRRDRLPDRLLGKIVEIEQKTAHFDKICVNLLIDYGGQNDIADACAKVCASGVPTVENIRGQLYNAFIPDPDLIVRTGGQKRLSNFLLFQAAYAELQFSDTLWPDFSEEELRSFVADYAARTRNFGGFE